MARKPYTICPDCESIILRSGRCACQHQPLHRRKRQGKDKQTQGWADVIRKIGKKQK